MGVLIKKQRGIFVFTGIAKLAILVMIVGLASAFVDTIWAVYMEELIGNASYVSFLSAFFTVVAFFSFFFLVPIVEKYKKSSLYALSVLFIGLFYILIAYSNNLYVFIFLAAILTAVTSLRITAFGIILKDKSKSGNLSRNEGITYTFFNIAWVIGPLLAGYIAQDRGFKTIFYLAAVFMFIALIVFKISGLKDGNTKKKIDGNVFKNFKAYFSDRDRTIAYIIGGGINFWFILIYLLMPIHIIESGLDTVWVGYFFFAFSIPLILFEYLAAKATARIGFRTMFKLGFAILALSSFLCFFVNNIYIAMGVLVFSALGVAMLEPTGEAYFFDILKKKGEESKYYGPYNTTIDTSHFIGKILAGFVLLLLPYRFIFIFFGIFMLFYFIFAFKTKNIKESKPRREYDAEEIEQQIEN